MTEVIHIENGYITQHLILTGELRDGDIAVKDWKGNVGDSVNFYNKDWTKKSLEQLLKEHLIEPVIEEKEIQQDEVEDEVEDEEDTEVDADVEVKKAEPETKEIDPKETEAKATEAKALPEQVLPSYTRTDELMIQLQEIDLASVRAIRAILSGTDTEEDHKTLEALEKQAVALRKELNEVDTESYATTNK